MKVKRTLKESAYLIESTIRSIAIEGTGKDPKEFDKVITSQCAKFKVNEQSVRTIMCWPSLKRKEPPMSKKEAKYLKAKEYLAGIGEKIMQ